MKEDGEVKAENITLNLQYLNADSTVLYEGDYTYADLAAYVRLLWVKGERTNI